MSQVQIPNLDHCIWRAWINQLCKSGLDPIDCKSSCTNTHSKGYHTDGTKKGIVIVVTGHWPTNTKVTYWAAPFTAKINLVHSSWIIFSKKKCFVPVKCISFVFCWKRSLLQFDVGRVSYVDSCRVPDQDSWNMKGDIFWHVMLSSPSPSPNPRSPKVPKSWPNVKNPNPKPPSDPTPPPIKRRFLDSVCLLQ